MAVILGWQFTLGEFVGGPADDRLRRAHFPPFLEPSPRRRGSPAGRPGSRSGGWRVTPRWTCPWARSGSIWQRLRPPAGFTATANYFVMDWAAIWIDIVGGLLIAGALAAWVPESWWQAIFFESHPTFAKFWGPLIGPLVAVVCFVCSIGNVPLAAVLWNGGISFGGVLAFIFADLIVLPILDIYRKYYGWRMAGFLLATSTSPWPLPGSWSSSPSGPRPDPEERTRRSSRRPSPGTTRQRSTSSSSASARCSSGDSSALADFRCCA